jgi:hypothetical protein
VLLGQNAAPANGDPVYSLAIRQGKYSVIPEIGKYVPFTATFANRGELGGWGVALGVPTAFTNTANGPAVNNGAASANGGAAFLHLLTAAATDRYSITVEGSATGAFGGEQTTLATFTLNGADRAGIHHSVGHYTAVHPLKATTSGGGRYRQNRRQLSSVLMKINSTRRKTKWLLQVIM